MRVAYLIAGACCLALSLGSAPSIAATAQKKVAQEPIYCMIAKKPPCDALCNKLNKCGSGCIEWGRCVSAKKDTKKKL